jgi:hypothetical protein
MPDREVIRKGTSFISVNSGEIYTVIECGEIEIKIENAYKDTGEYRMWRSVFDDALRRKLFKLL